MSLINSNNNYSPQVAEYLKKYENISKFEFHTNSVDIDTLFNHYELEDRKHPFLYKQKKERIGDYFPLIKKNWTLAWNAGHKILWTLIYCNEKQREMTTVTFWRYTKNCWAAQHLTSTGYPMCVLSMMLKAQIEGITRGYNSLHNFFSSTNPYAEEKFGSVVRSLDQNYATVYSMNYYKVTQQPAPPENAETNSKFNLEQITNQSSSTWISFVEKIQGPIYVACEELKEPDVELIELDKIYNQYGLSRRRYIWITRNKTGQIKGLIIVNRAPFGFNFSLLENRCDLFIDRNLELSDKEAICCLLLSKAWEAFFKSDFILAYPINYIQVMVNNDMKEVFERAVSCEFIKKYERSIWLNEEFSQWYNRIESFLPESEKKSINKKQQASDPHYFLKETDSETWRLANKVDPQKYIKQYLVPLIRPDDKILDVGSGPAVIDCELAKQFPESQIIAMDNNLKRLQTAQDNIEAANLNNVSAKHGDAHEIPFQDNSFDFVFARFLLEYLPFAESVIHGMKRVTKTGGRVMAQDLDGQLVWHYPEDEFIGAQLNKILMHLKETSGFDPFIGRKLYHMFYQADLKNIETKAESYHLFAGPMDETNQLLWFYKLSNAKNKIIEALNSEKKADEFIQAYMNYFTQKHTLTYSVVFTVSGVK
jgi:ubiquinone/menaquinone biosynthesis C-methylase UbiE